MWVDSVRAVAVCAVVLFHVVLWHTSQATAAPGAGHQTLAVAARWDALNGLAASLRMPALVCVSGFLISRKLRAGGAHVVRAAAANMWLYAVWVAIFAAVSIALVPGTPHRIGSPLEAISQFIMPTTPLWFLLALACYSLMMLALRRVPTVVVVAGLALLAIMLSALLPAAGSPLWRKIGMLAVYYAIGARLPDLIVRLGSKASALRSVAALAVVGALIYVDRFATHPWAAAGLSVARNIVVIAAAVTVLAWATRWRPLGTALSWIGRRTLPIYVVHVLVVQAIVSVSIAVPAAFAWANQSAAVALLYPPLLTALTVAACVAVGAIIKKAGASFLLELPAAWWPVPQRANSVRAA